MSSFQDAQKNQVLEAEERKAWMAPVVDIHQGASAELGVDVTIDGPSSS
jgi:hypothetical protein